MTTSAQFPSNVAAIRIEAANTAQKIDALPDHIFNTEYHMLVQQACIESFYVNVRTLIEFLRVHAANQDVSAADTLAGWSPTLTSAEKATLEAHWRDASKHLVHFSHQRTTVIEPSEAEVRRVADDVLAVWDQFATASAHLLVQPRTNFAMYRN